MAALVAVTAALAAATVWVGRAVADRDLDRSDQVRAELAELRRGLDGGSAERMQGQFPEGYFFMYVLYGLSWTNLAAAGRADPVVARAEAGLAAARLDADAGRAPFTESLTPRYGVFYAGWSLLLHAELAAVGPGGRDPAATRRVTDEAEALAEAFAAPLDGDGSPFLASYPGGSWPVDSVVAMAALRRADKVAGTHHGALVDRWVARAAPLVDPATGLLPHRTDPETGRAVEAPRASSQSIIGRFWPLVDPAGAPVTYGRFRELFVTSRLGAAGVREHLPGDDGGGDVDSGPLLAGVSASSTTVTIAAARANGDLGLATALTQEAEASRLPLLGRRYLLGAEPVADAFVAWARSVPPAPGSVQPDLVVWWPLPLALPWAVVAGAWVALAVRRRRLGPPDDGR